MDFYRTDKDNAALIKALPIGGLVGGAMPGAKVKQKTLELGFSGPVVSSCKLILFDGTASGASGRAPTNQTSLGGGSIKEFDCGSPPENVVLN